MGNGAAAIGGFSTTAVGYEAEAMGPGSSALGADSNAEDGGTAIGAGTVASESSVAVGVAAWGYVEGSVAVGRQSRAFAQNGVAIGFGAAVTDTAQNSIALGANSVADQANTISVGAVGAERQIVNVAAGDVSADSTDAVNGAQLHATNEAVAAQGTAITTLQTQYSSMDNRVTALEAIAGNLGSLQGSVDQLFDLRKSDRRDMKQGVAAAMAITDAPIPSRPGGISYVVSGASFRGEHALAGSISYRLNTSSPMAVSAGFAYGGNKNNGVKVAFSGEF